MKKKILKSFINEGSLEEHAPKLILLAKNNTPSYVCFPNVHMLIEAYDDDSFQDVVNNATYALPDGTPVAKMFKFLYNVEQKRIAGMDFFPYFLKQCNAHSLRVSFIGSTHEVLNKIKSRIHKDFKKIEITCIISPPFNKDWDNDDYTNQINSKKTHVVFVALGCPLQERWMYNHSKNINALLIGVGGAFPVYVGLINRAPSWMQKNSLEWLYRLYKEPKRMMYRYLYTNTKFIYLAVLQIIKK